MKLSFEEYDAVMMEHRPQWRGLQIEAKKIRYDEWYAGTPTEAFYLEHHSNGLPQSAIDYVINIIRAVEAAEHTKSLHAIEKAIEL